LTSISKVTYGTTSFKDGLYSHLRPHYLQINISFIGVFIERVREVGIFDHLHRTNAYYTITVYCVRYNVDVFDRQCKITHVLDLVKPMFREN